MLTDQRLWLLNFLFLEEIPVKLGRPEVAVFHSVMASRSSPQADSAAAEQVPQVSLTPLLFTCSHLPKIPDVLEDLTNRTSQENEGSGGAQRSLTVAKYQSTADHGSH